jgi:hypothetical protein
VKRIIRYVAGTLDHTLYYPRCPGEAHLVGYSDSDHLGFSLNPPLRFFSQITRSPTKRGWGELTEA